MAVTNEQDAGYRDAPTPHGQPAAGSGAGTDSTWPVPAISPILSMPKEPAEVM